MRNIALAGILFFGLNGHSAPARPTEAAHPGSDVYEFTVKHDSLRLLGRAVDVYLPVNAAGDTPNVPVVVYGHGQAIGLDGYEATFTHLARKGVAVIYPTYDKGFFDQEWRRMAKDYNDLTAEALRAYAGKINPAQIVYSGHSKGAYIALMAAGAPDLNATFAPGAVVVFAPAGYDAEYLSRLPVSTPLHIIWGERDGVIGRPALNEIYNRAPSQHKQFIEVKSYPDLAADHFFMLNKSYFFGGEDGVSALHFYAAWKWILGAAWDVQAGGLKNNSYIYGDQTDSSGDPAIKHILTRSW